MARQVLALTAGLGRRPALAVQRLGENARDGGLADATGSGEQEGMVHAARIQRIGERTDHVFLPNQFGETLGAPLAGEDEIGHSTILPRRDEFCPPRHDQPAPPRPCDEPHRACYPRLRAFLL
jgi:hypothetical protein